MRSCPSLKLTVILLVLLETCGASKLNVPRVLLPYSSSPPSFSLTSEAGCYSWSTTRPDILSLQLEDTQCSASAVSWQFVVPQDHFLFTLLAGDPGQSDHRRENQRNDHG